MSEKNRLIWFSGKECVHCKRARPLVEQLESGMGSKVTELEVWHSEENAMVMRGYGDAISKACGGDLGVPAFYNEKTGKVLCGVVTLDKLKAWAQG